MNPTKELLTPVLERTGYRLRVVNVPTLDSMLNGLEIVLDCIRESHLVVVDDALVFTDPYTSGHEVSRGFREYFGKRADFVWQLTSAIQQELTITSRPKVVHVNHDAYNLRQEQTDRLKDIADIAVVNWGPQDMRLVSENPSISREAFAVHATDNYAMFLRRYPERIAVLPHFVAPSEFNITKLSDRDDKWTVPGVHYRRRQEAARELRSASRLASPLPLRQLGAVGVRLGVNPFTSSTFLRAYRSSFRSHISKFRWTYTCGSEQELIHRKHVEIPAFGSLLVSAPFASSQELGFLHGVNCFIATPDELLELDSWFRRHPEETARIAGNGQLMVGANHSLFARSLQWRQTIDSVLGGTFSGGGWSEGRYVLR